MLNVLRTSVDWFEYSCRGELRDGLAEELERLKTLAQTEDSPQPLRPAPMPLYVARSGAKPWAWVVKGDELHLRFSAAKRVSAASALLLSDGLATYGHEGLYRLSVEVLDLYTRTTPSVCSRVDLAVDFQGWEPVPADMDNIVCRATYTATHGHHGVEETYQFGQDALVVRIYNKTRQLPTVGKFWLFDAWAQSTGFDEGRDVWRFEAQMRREGVQSFGVRSPDEVLEALPELLGSMLSWCSLRVPRGANRSRWPEDPRWGDLREGSFSGAGLRRVPEQKRLAAFDMTARQVKGHLLSAAAARGIDDFDQAWGVLGHKVRTYVEEQGDFGELVKRRRAERTG